ncbi:TetR/AcrR family transcriptional regulator [Brumicola blandensis]|uniref:TetR/AcrR family transcriptional regulator n=1 Tax=Brumicola blandensis TaxID=3075611 RepID=A0AAW8R5F3_9ALTE|nr:TetR/AcrR family transcriptional regulator [Alteromonas sp. W409]MDT0583371.1 TetR/AcrR family transcriptional regulator [Alteromonas sp. W409]
MSVKREQLLDAANILLAEKGYHGFSMKELAQTAEIAVGTTYLYFNDKKDLIQSLHQRNLHTLAESMFDGFDATSSIFEQYSCIWRNFWQYSLNHPEAILAKSQFDHLPSIVQLREELLAKELFKEVGIMLHVGVEKEIFKPLPIDVLATLSIETCANLARKHILGITRIEGKLLDDVILACWNSIAFKPESTK